MHTLYICIIYYICYIHICYLLDILLSLTKECDCERFIKLVQNKCLNRDCD